MVQFSENTVSYAPGGTGKTFLLNTLMAEIRGNKYIAIACAFVGVAAVLLDGGTTVHKRFKIITQGPRNSIITFWIYKRYDNIDFQEQV